MRQTTANSVATVLVFLAFTSPVCGQVGSSNQQHLDLKVPEEYALTDIVDFVATDSAVFILDRLLRSVLVFDARTGAFVRSIGRSGQGPGEMLSPWRLQIGVGDTLWITDLGNDRIQAVSRTNGGMLGQISGHNLWANIPGVAGAPIPMGVLATGEVLVAVDEFGDGSIVRLRALAREWPIVARNLARVDYSDRTIMVAIPGREQQLRIRNPFSASEMFAISSRGSAIAVVRPPEADGAIVVSQTDLVSEEEVDTEVGVGRRPIESGAGRLWADTSGVADELFEAGLFPDRRSALAAIDHALPQANLAPAIPGLGRGMVENSIRFSSDDELWILTEGANGAHVWQQSNGQNAGRSFALPFQGRLLGISGNSFWLERLDQFGVPSVTRVGVSWGR